MIRALALLVVIAIAFAACDRYVNLSPPPDAHHTDAAHDGGLPDAGNLLDSAAISDAFPPPD